MDKRKLYRAKTGKLRIYLYALGITLLLLSYVGVQMIILSLEKQVLAAREKQTVLEREIKSLEIEVAELSKGSRIKKIAHEKLGMEMPVGAPEPLF